MQRFSFSLLSPYALVFAAGIAWDTAALAQTNAAPAAVAAASVATPASDAKRVLASRMVALQHGPELDRTVFQLTNSAVQPLIDKWGVKLEKLPAAKQEKARKELDAELKKLGDSTRKIIEAQMPLSGNKVLQNAYLDRFSEDELKTLVSMFEAPVFKKYQAVAPELGNLWIGDVIENSREAVITHSKAFDDAAAKILGEKPVAAKK